MQNIVTFASFVLPLSFQLSWHNLFLFHCLCFYGLCTETKASVLQKNTHRNSPQGSNQDNDIIWISNQIFCLWPVAGSVHAQRWIWPYMLGLKQGYGSFEYIEGLGQCLVFETKTPPSWSYRRFTCPVCWAQHQHRHQQVTQYAFLSHVV